MEEMVVGIESLHGSRGRRGEEEVVYSVSLWLIGDLGFVFLKGSEDGGVETSFGFLYRTAIILLINWLIN